MKPYIQQYHSQGCVLFPINSKKEPLVSNWQNLQKTKKNVVGADAVGWSLRDDHLVIDIDPRNGGDKSFERLLDDVDGLREIVEQGWDCHVLTPSGGTHIYLKGLAWEDDQGRAVTGYHKTLRNYPGIDFLKKGNYCVIAGSTVDSRDGESRVSYRYRDPIEGEFQQLNVNKGLTDLLAYDNVGSVDVDNARKTPRQSLPDDGVFCDLIEAEPGGLNSDDIRKLLEPLDPAMGHDDGWLKVIMALFSWCGGSDEGLELAHEWSAQAGDDIYDARILDNKWQSFFRGYNSRAAQGNRVSVASLVRMSREVRVRGEEMRLNDWKRRIINCQTVTDLNVDVLPKLCRVDDDNLGYDSREVLAGILQGRLKEINGTKPSISRCREMVVYKGDKLKGGQGNSGHGNAGSDALDDDLDVPAWCNDWIYVRSHNSFFHLKENYLYSASAFNQSAGVHVPLGRTGAKPSASAYVANYGFCRGVHGIAYLPMYEDRVLNMEGLEYINSFDSKSLPFSDMNAKWGHSDEMTDDGREVIQMIQQHILMLCNGKQKYADILTQWLAHQVQRPGQKILWSPVIVSIQGIGKSFFSEMLATCLNDLNIGTVKSDQVMSSFNGWATGVCVNVLEELRVKGQNRYEAINALKPLITDRRIQINEKGVKPYSTYNTTNYICFTNYRDALPLDEHDRRWWVIYNEIGEIKEIDNHELYFPRLFDGLRRQQKAVLWWLKYGVELSDYFLNLKQAPMTEYKKMMIETEDSIQYGKKEAMELLEKGGDFFNKNCISSSEFFISFMEQHPEISLETTRRNLFLKNLGYSFIKRIRIKGKFHRIWAAKSLERSDILLSFNIENDENA